MPGIDDITVAEFLPPALQVIPRLLNLVQDPDSNSDAIVDVIRLDPGLTADVLRVSNSAAFAGDYRIETISLAVNRLGLRELYRVTLQVVTSVAFSQVQEIGRPQVDFWDHSLLSAVAAQVLALRSPLGFDPEVAFTAGLLHDLGKFALWHEYGEKYLSIAARAHHENRSIVELEQLNFGVDHAALGGRLLTEWNLSPEVARAVAFHHSCDTPKIDPLTALVCLADQVTHALHDNESSPKPTFSAHLPKLLGLSPAEITDLLPDVLLRAAHEKRLLNPGT